MASSSKTPILYLFCKKPVPGKVKTRLAKQIGEHCAWLVAIALLEKTLAAVCLHWPGKVILSVWPDSNHPAIRRLIMEHKLVVTHQPAGDLGVKMYAFLADASTNQPIAIMGCDLITCPESVLQLAYTALCNGENVIGPARDGGFYFIGCCISNPNMFDGIDWGAGPVLSSTLQQCRKHGICFPNELATLEDVDQIEAAKIFCRLHGLDIIPNL